LDAALSDHFGSAPCFTFYEVASGRIDVLANAGASHAHGACDPTGHVRARDAGAVVCRGLGRRALERLAGIGVDVYVTDETTVRRAIEAYTLGGLVPMRASEACGGHGDCDHSHEGA